MKNLNLAKIVDLAKIEQRLEGVEKTGTGPDSFNHDDICNTILVLDRPSNSRIQWNVLFRGWLQLPTNNYVEIT